MKRAGLVMLNAYEISVGDVRVKPVLPKAEAAATRLLLRAVKGSRAPLVLLPALVLHEAGGSFTTESEALHRGEATIAWFV